MGYGQCVGEGQGDGVMNGFAYWIFGYQKFAEPILRKCICLEKGWEDISEETKTPPIKEVINNLNKCEDWDKVFPFLKQEALKALSNRKRPMVLDAAFKDKDGKIIIAEFKSWAGFCAFTPEKLYQEITNGKMFPDRLAINSVYYQKESFPVLRFVIITSLCGNSDKRKQWNIGNLAIEVFDTSDLLLKHGSEVVKQYSFFDMLDQSVEKVKKYIMTGNMADILPPAKIEILETTNMKDDVQIYIDDNEGYLCWLEENAMGFIVNSYRHPTPDYLILHKATCGTIRHATRGEGNWTNTGFIKICSLDKTKLSEWAESQVRGDLKPCQICKP